MALAQQVEERIPAVGNRRFDLIIGCQQRLRIALAFVPKEMLPQTRRLIQMSAQDVAQPEPLEASANELAELARQLAPASFRTE
jgi:hypothetical protein